MGPFESTRQLLNTIEPVGIAGRVVGVRGLTVHVADFPAPVGADCRIIGSSKNLAGRVIGFAGDAALVMPLGAMAGVRRGDRVTMTSAHPSVAVGSDMLGRVLDGFARPLDEQGPYAVEAQVPVWPEPIRPLQRPRITEPLPTGVRVIDAMLTVGHGQRMGVFSGSGLGKSVLLGMIARYTTADIRVIALIGERGREVRDFIEKHLGDEGLQRSVVIVSTGDEPPLVRVQAAAVAVAVAEYFRDSGHNVLLLMDSLTRLAWAQRQIGLAAGEPPTTRGYTPSVFSLLPELLERSGRTERGSITGFYSILVEGDDLAEPLCDAVRSVTDGHIVLSRQLASRGHYPAVDVLASTSRIMLDVTDADHQAAAKALRRLLAVYADIEDMVNVGAVQPGANAEADLAIEAQRRIRRFLEQDIHQQADFVRTLAELKELHQSIQKYIPPADPPIPGRWTATGD